jgi:hypothetical protein
MLLDLKPILGNFRDKAEVNATSQDKKSILLRVKIRTQSRTSGFKTGTSCFKSGTSGLFRQPIVMSRK